MASTSMKSTTNHSPNMVSKLFSYLLGDQFCCNVDTALDGAGYRAFIGMKPKDPLGSFPLIGFYFQMIGDMNSFDHQNVAVLLDFTPNL